VETIATAAQANKVGAAAQANKGEKLQQEGKKALANKKG